MSIDEDPITIRLARSLSYFEQEGIDIVPVDLEKIAGEDYLMQEALMKGRIDASYHWFNHAIFGARHGFPIKAVMVFNDAPGMTVMVANRVKGEVRGVADFEGRRIAEGAGAMCSIESALAQTPYQPHPDDCKLMLEVLARDRYGIAYAGNSYRTPRVKALALAQKSGGPFVALTPESVANRTYPLSRSAYIYFAPDTPTGDRAQADPKVREFLRYVLSRQGQEDVLREGDHLPLTPALAQDQLKKLD